MKALSFADSFLLSGIFAVGMRYLESNPTSENWAMLEEKKYLHHDRFVVQQKTCGCKRLWVDQIEAVLCPGLISWLIAKLDSGRCPIRALVFVLET